MDSRQTKTLRYVNIIQKVKRRLEALCDKLDDRSALREAKNHNEFDDNVLSEFYNPKWCAYCFIILAICFGLEYLVGHTVVFIHTIATICAFLILCMVLCYPILLLIKIIEEVIFILIRFFQKTKTKCIRHYLKG